VSIESDLRRSVGCCGVSGAAGRFGGEENGSLPLRLEDVATEIRFPEPVHLHIILLESSGNDISSGYVGGGAAVVPF
jgi:hypothetical protein